MFETFDWFIGFSSFSTLCSVAMFETFDWFIRFNSFSRFGTYQIESSHAFGKRNISMVVTTQQCFNALMGDVVAQWLVRGTWDQKVESSSPGRCTHVVF